MVMASVRSEKTNGKTLTLSGPKAWTTQEVIALCEKLSDSDANVTTVPTWLLKRTRAVLRSLQWANDAADRLVGGGTGGQGSWSCMRCIGHLIGSCVGVAIAYVVKSSHAAAWPHAMPHREPILI